MNVVKIIKGIVPFSSVPGVPSAKDLIFNDIHDNAERIENFIFLVAKYHVYNKVYGPVS